MTKTPRLPQRSRGITAPMLWRSRLLDTIVRRPLYQPTKRCITKAMEVDKAAAPNIIPTIQLTSRVSICAMSAFVA